MKSIGRAWVDSEAESSKDFVTKICNFHHEIARWHKNNPPYGKREN